MPNDPTINFHRFFQVAILALYTLLYGLVHAYYMWCGPLPLSNKEPPSIYLSRQLLVGNMISRITLPILLMERSSL